jgi:hypothetical protein
MSENPYSISEISDPAASSSSEDAALMTIARKTFLAWEKLRVIYVVLLGIWTLILVGPFGLTSFPILRLIVLGAVLANVLYFAGPTIETYIRWLGYRRLWPRVLMFLGGTLLSMILATAALALTMLPDQA